MTIWGDTWYITYLKTLGLTVLGLALVVFLSYLLDKRLKKKRALRLLEQHKGHLKITHFNYIMSGHNLHYFYYAQFVYFLFKDHSKGVKNWMTR